MKKAFLTLVVLFFFISISFAQLGKKAPGHAQAYPMTVNSELKKIFTGESSNRTLAKGEFNIKSISPILPTAGQSIIKETNGYGLPVWVEGDLIKGDLSTRGSVQDIALSFFQQNSKVLQITDPGNEFRLVQQTSDDDGKSHLRFDQYYKGLPVWDSEVMLHFKNNKPYLFNGRYIPTPSNLDIIPTIQVSAAQDVVTKELDMKSIPQSELNLINGKQIETQLLVYTDINNTKPAILAYKIDVHPDILNYWTYFIDAHTGAIIHKIYQTCSWNHNQNTSATNTHIQSFTPHTTISYRSPLDGPATASAADLNGVNRTVNSYQIGSDYYLINATKSMYQAGASNLPDNPVGAIWTINGLNNSPSNQNFNPAHITSGNNDWNSNPTAVSAHYNADVSFDYYKTKFNRNSIDGKGGTIISIINITEPDGSGLDNAFWNGAAMFYGNGAQAFKPLAGGLDVGGHEMTHGVIQATANLTYENESGALNESFADIFGVCIDREDYQLGEDIVNLNYFPTGAMRDMSNPHNGGNSINDNGWQPNHTNEKYSGSDDNGGVHTNSGIVNFAFYKVSSQIGKDAAEQIYYNALSKYLTKSSQFIDCRNAVIQATKDYYPNDQSKVTLVENAYSEVGIGAGSGTTEPDDYETNPGKDIVIYASADHSSLYVKDLQSTQETLINNTLGVLSKPSVSDDGKYAVFVGNDKKLYIAVFTWPNPTPEFYYILDPNDQNQFRNVAISKKGNLVACTLDDETPKIYIIDLASGNIKDFDLYNPTTGNGDPSTADVKFADALEFNHTGDYVMYDSYNEIGFQGTAYWDIGFLRAWDNQSKTFGDGRIEKLFSSLPPNTSVGNPVFSKNSPNIIAMDYVEDNKYYLVGANIEKGNTGLIYQNNDINYPTFSKDDKYVIFNAKDNTSKDVIGVQELLPSKIQASTTNAFVLINDATFGNWFGTGSRSLNSVTLSGSNENVSLSPSIVSKSTCISWISNQINAANIDIFNSNGQLMTHYNWNTNPGLNEYTIDCSDLKSGIYFVRISSENTSGTLKFQKIESR